MDEQPTIHRTADEIQRAHDVLVGALLNEQTASIVFAGDGDRQLTRSMDLACMAVDVLCWFLGHDHNTAFAQNLEQIEQAMKDLGYVVHDTGCLQDPNETTTGASR